jgi:hypothetical protein
VPTTDNFDELIFIHIFVSLVPKELRTENSRSPFSVSLIDGSRERTSGRLVSADPNHVLV